MTTMKTSMEGIESLKFMSYVLPEKKNKIDTRLAVFGEDVVINSACLLKEKLTLQAEALI